VGVGLFRREGKGNGKGFNLGGERGTGSPTQSEEGLIKSHRFQGGGRKGFIRL